MAAPMSVRFDDSVLARLRQRAAGMPGATPSGLVQQLVDEGLRMAEHPGIVFKDGPAGRRAALVAGPDVREVVTVVREVDERGEAALVAAAEILALEAERVEAALDYYAAHAAEIDAEIDAAQRASEAAEAAWRARQHLIA